MTADFHNARTHQLPAQEACSSQPGQIKWAFFSAWLQEEETFPHALLLVGEVFLKPSPITAGSKHAHDDRSSYVFILYFSEKGRASLTAYILRFPWSGWSCTLLLLDAEPKQADLPPWRPLSAGRKFSVVRGRSHCESSYTSIEAGNMSIHNALACIFNHRTCCLARTTAHWKTCNIFHRVSRWDISFGRMPRNDWHRTTCLW